MEKQEKQEKMSYAAPQLTVVTFKTERGYASSRGLFGLFRGWSDNGNDAWSGSDGQESGNRFGGWSDNGGSAWD